MNFPDARLDQQGVRNHSFRRLWTTSRLRHHTCRTIQQLLSGRESARCVRPRMPVGKGKTIAGPRTCSGYHEPTLGTWICRREGRQQFQNKTFQQRESLFLVTRSHLINTWTSRKGRRLQSETLETQPNHHFPPVAITRVLWLSCHKTIYEITSSLKQY
jgi:hypothetical protein